LGHHTEFVEGSRMSTSKADLGRRMAVWRHPLWTVLGMMGLSLTLVALAAIRPASALQGSARLENAFRRSAISSGQPEMGWEKLSSPQLPGARVLDFATSGAE
jgi:hypothetical protein